MQQMIDAYKQTLDHTGTIVANVKPDQFDGETPCSNFTTKELLNHIIGGHYFFADVVAGKPVDADAPVPDLAGDDPASAYEASSKMILDVVSAPDFFAGSYTFPFGTLAGPAAMGIALLESVAHGWDLATATGQDATVDPMVASMLLAGARQAISPEIRNESGNPFGPEIAVPDSASPTDKLVAFLGRTP